MRKGQGEIDKESYMTHYKYTYTRQRILTLGDVISADQLNGAVSLRAANRMTCSETASAVKGLNAV
jgi:hypothetical protein